MFGTLSDQVWYVLLFAQLLKASDSVLVTLRQEAQSFLAAQYVGIIVAAVLILGEPISPLRWLGMGLIVAGMVVVGSTAK